MCGITVIINKKKSSIDKNLLKSMNDKVKHRGPDGEGFYIDSNIGLGHRRLSIIDLTENANQPMIFDDIILTYNGEIYNYIELKNELIEKGYQFKTNSDSEVIIRSYQEWSFDCVKKFNGMWSFCIYDKNIKKVFISRDRFGIKPLYFFENKKSIFLASEIKQILCNIDQPKVNKNTLFNYLYLNMNDACEETFFKDIMIFKPSHYLVFDMKNGLKKEVKYYNLKEELESNRVSDDKNFFENNIRNSVNFRLRSDVKVGICLSGGLDSSAIAATCHSIIGIGKNLTAINAKSIDRNKDESNFAKIVCEKFNLDLDFSEIDKRDFDNNINKIIEAQEEPFLDPSVAMQFFVMKQAKINGCKVMLDGQGGDETLLGYERYFVPYLRSLSFLSRIKNFIKLSNNSKLSYYNLISYIMYFRFPLIKKLYILFKNRFIKQKNFSFTSKKLLYSFLKSSNSLKELIINEIYKIQLPKLLRYEDKNSMFHSIEARVPFLDHEFVEYCINLNNNQKIKNGWSKFILRNYLSNKSLNKIAWRKNKYGFEAPKQFWMKKKDLYIDEINKSEFIKNIIKKNSNLANIDLKSLWKLYNIAVWSKIYNVKY